MATISYEVRFFDRAGQLTHVRELSSDSAAAAIDRVADLPNRFAMEMWCAERLVRRFEIDD